MQYGYSARYDLTLGALDRVVIIFAVWHRRALCAIVLRMLAQRGRPEGESRYSWTMAFAARRAKNRADMQPSRDEAAQIKASEAELLALNTEMLAKDKAARDVETMATGIDAAVVDVDTRTPQQIIENVEAQGRIVADALTQLHTLMTASEAPA